MAILSKVISAMRMSRPQAKVLIESHSLLLHSIDKNANFNLREGFPRLGVVFSKAHYLMMIVFVAGIFLTGCNDDDDDKREKWEQEVDQLRSSVASYDDIGHATDKGYNSEITGYVSQMGFHYLKASILDESFDIKNPEILVYIPDDHGGLKFVAVEYAVPIPDLDHPTPAPEGFSGDKDEWVINTEFKVWTLHVWVGMDNPHGIFHPHNPNIP